MSDEKPPTKLTVLSPAKPKKADDNVVHMLEHMLEKAKKAELRSILIVGHYDGLYGHDHAGIDSTQEILSYIAMCDVMKQNLLDILEINQE